MKKLVIILIAALTPLLVNAQQSEIDKLIKKYSGQEGVTAVNIGPELFQIMDGMEIKEVKNAEFPVDKLKAVQVLSIENKELLKGANFFEEVTSALNTQGLVEIMSVQEKDEDVKMWMKADGKQIKDFLIVVSSPDEGVVVYIKGDFKMSDIEGMAEKFGGIEGLEDMDI